MICNRWDFNRQTNTRKRNLPMDSLSSAYAQRKALKHNYGDGISQLPEEILVSILSKLTVKEAAATSVLSRRWRYVWTRIRKLDFDECSTKSKCPDIELQKFIKLEPCRYISWVKSVMSSHQGLSLDYFKALVFPGLMSESEIYEWVNFALAKGSKTLELHTHSPGDRIDFSAMFYRSINSSLPNSMSWIKPLKTLKLFGALVTGELIHFLLSNCPQLGTLEVKHSSNLVNLRIDHGASLQLHHLGIFYCDDLENIEIITAPNLVSFAYIGRVIGLRVESAPSLVRVCLGSFAIKPEFAFVSLAKFLPQLEALELRIGKPNSGYNLEFSHGELTKLRHLTLSIFVSPGESLLAITRMIEASPSLEKFTLELRALERGGGVRGIAPRRSKIRNYPHYNLKEVEIDGFAGYRADLELGQYLLQNAVALEKFVINVTPKQHVGYAWEFDDSKMKQNGRKKGKELEKMVKRKVDFQIIN